MEFGFHFLDRHLLWWKKREETFVDAPVCRLLKKERGCIGQMLPTWLLKPIPALRVWLWGYEFSFSHMWQATLIIIWLLTQLTFREKLCWPEDMSILSSLQLVYYILVKNTSPGVRDTWVPILPLLFHQLCDSKKCLHFWASVLLVYKMRTVMNVFLTQVWYE